MARRKTTKFEEEIEDLEDDLEDLEDELEDDDEEEAPPKRSRSKAAPAPKARRAKAAPVEDDEDDDDEEEDEAPPKRSRSKAAPAAKKRSAKAKPAVDEEEEEAPPKRSRSKAKPTAKAKSKVKTYDATYMDRDGLRARTPKGRVMFPNLFSKYVSQGDDDEDGKYMVSLLFDEDTDLTVLDELIEDALSAKFGKKWPKNWQSPIREGEEKEEKYPVFGEYPFFISASTQYKPGVIDIHKNELFDDEDVYSGCYGRMTVVAYGWQFKGKSGVSFGLRNFQKLDEGEEIQSGGNASDDFDD